MNAQVINTVQNSPPAGGDGGKAVIVIVGPTAVGKTTVAIELAKYFQTEIISADSRQCFKELSIGVARPSAKELQEVEHHFIASHSIQDEVNAASFEKYALEKINTLFENQDVVVMVGGTGLYIKAFCEGLDEIPEIQTGIRNTVVSDYNNNGIQWLQDQIKKNDPDYSIQGEMQNPQRLMRALEVKLSTGRSILEFRKNKKTEREFNIIKIGLELTKEELHRNINTRVDAMIEAGLLNEVKGLIIYKELNALQTVGYSEIFDYLDEKVLPAGRQVSFDEAIERIKTNTRQYAKRQMTWFKKDKEIEWFAPAQLNEMIEFAVTQSSDITKKKPA